MLQKILNTTLTRILVAFISFIIIILNSKQLGSQGLGNASLIALAIAIFVLINDFIGGGTLIYFVPRLDVFHLLIISYSWTFVTAMLYTLLSFFVDLAPEQYQIHIVLISIILSLTTINLRIIAGKQKIKLYNYINLLQIILIMLSLMFYYFITNEKDVISYIYSLYIAYIFTFILSFYFIKKYIIISIPSNLINIFNQVAKLGFYTLISGVTQKLNYRLSYYFIEHFLGIKSVGKYSVGVQISESTWIMGRSLAFVQYSRIANLSDKEKAKEITLMFIKFIFVLSVLISAVLMLIPPAVYLYVFGHEFTEIREIILSLVVGIVALSCSFMFSHYFSGIGENKINTYASLIGVIITAVLGLILIPKYHLIGAGITASLSYTILTVFQAIMFMKMSHSYLYDFVIKTKDIEFGFNTIKYFFLSSKNKKK